MDPRQVAASEWTNEPWSYWLPDLIKGEHWRDLRLGSGLLDLRLPPSPQPQHQSHGHRDLGLQEVRPTGASNCYFCTQCLDWVERLDGHANHATLKVAILNGSLYVLAEDIKALYDVSEIMRRESNDGQHYLLLRSPVRSKTNRRLTKDRISCTHCLLFETIYGPYQCELILLTRVSICQQVIKGDRHNVFAYAAKTSAPLLENRELRSRSAP